MLYNIIVFIIYFSSMLISYVFFSQIGEMKNKISYSIIIGTILFGIGAIIDIVFSNTVWLNALSFMLINIIFALLCFKINFTKILFYSIIINVFNGAWEIVTLWLISRVTHTAPGIYLDNINIFIIDALISKTLYFFTCVLLSKFVKKETTNIKFPTALYIYPIVIVSTLLALWKVCVDTNIPNGLQTILSVISFALFFSIVILFLIYQRNIEKENRLFLLQNEFDRIKTDKTYYDILEKQNQELMIYAHDAKKHLSTIKALNSNPIIDEYINTMTNALKAHSSSCHSGNHLLDVIMNKYETECQMKNIKFSFDVKLCNLNFVNSYDLVAILNNLLDNAIEAATGSQNAFISFSTNYTNTYAVITIINSCFKPPTISNNKLLTTKEDKTKHGIGIKSVKKTLKKYDGDMNWEYEKNNNTFISTVMLLEK